MVTKKLLRKKEVFLCRRLGLVRNYHLLLFQELNRLGICNILWRTIASL